MNALERGWPTLLIVDVMMPGMDGFELSRRIKRIADLPIIMLSAVDEGESKVRALEEHAEDYITKPFNPDELVARVQRVMRRAGTGRPQLTLDDGELEIDLAGKRVVTRAGNHSLSPIETRFLQILMGSLDRTVATDTLLDRVWSDADGADPSYVWVTVRRLRRKLESTRTIHATCSPSAASATGSSPPRARPLPGEAAMSRGVRLFLILLVVALPPLSRPWRARGLGECW